MSNWGYWIFKVIMGLMVSFSIAAFLFLVINIFIVAIITKIFDISSDMFFTVDVAAWSFLFYTLISSGLLLFLRLRNQKKKNEQELRDLVLSDKIFNHFIKEGELEERIELLDEVKKAIDSPDGERKRILTNFIQETDEWLKKQGIRQKNFRNNDN